MKAYTSDSCLRLARRVNNPKRAYLLVNPLQGKHLPVSPSQALEMMRTLGRHLAAEFPETKLVIGFAETATAIGAAAADCFGPDCVYLHTTREPLPAGSALPFLEEHSHAAEQFLYTRELEGWLEQTDTVVFVDDELSTGKTLRNILQCLKARFPALAEKRLIAASILNRLTPENEAFLEAAGMTSRYLVKLPQEDYGAQAARFSVREAAPPPAAPSGTWTHLPARFPRPRLGVNAQAYGAECRRIAGVAVPLLPEASRLLVLGAEECMFPALVLGAELEKAGHTVRCHATTRSPIGIGSAPDYPIREGWRLPSLFDAARTTYLYNLDRYDAALLVCESGEAAGLEALAAALEVHGYGDLYWIGGIT